MSKQKKGKPVDRAKPVIRSQKNTDVARIHVTRTTATAMQGSPEWANAPQVQAATAVWTQSVDSLEANAKTIADLRAQLAAAVAAQRGHRRDWSAATQHVLANVALHTKGSADGVHSFGIDVRTQVAGLTLAAPGEIASKPGKDPGAVQFTWKRGSARHGFLVQHASDPADPVKISVPVPCTKAKFTVSGLASAAMVHFRVAAIDPSVPSGTSPWSEWVGGTAR